MVNDFGPPMANQFGPPAAVAPRTNGLAIASLCCGIVGFLAFPCAILAIVFGHIAHRDIRRTGEDGHGLALAGVILGYVALVVGIFLLLSVLYLIRVVDATAPGTMPG